LPDFRSIYESEVNYIWVSLSRLGVRERDLEDLTHDVFAKFFQNYGAYDPDRPLRPWLFAFAARVASEHRRLARHRYEVATDAVEAGAPSSAPEGAIERAEQRAVLAEAMGALDEDKRLVFVLHDLEEVATPEIARALGIPEGTVSSRLRAGRAEVLLAVKRIRARKGAP
jgi:RNA polymerase sigma-70 factor (ECF subfamily)